MTTYLFLFLPVNKVDEEYAEKLFSRRLLFQTGNTFHLLHAAIRITKATGKGFLSCFVVIA